MVNPYHKHELSRKGFLSLLTSVFDDVQILDHKDTLHNGTQTTCIYGICEKGE